MYPKSHLGDWISKETAATLITIISFQDLEVNTDKEDSRCLHVTVHSRAPATSTLATKKARTPLLSATFTFDDHIRCMAAKQRYTHLYCVIRYLQIVFREPLVITR